MHVMFIVLPWLIKISPAASARPSGTPRIWVIGSENMFSNLYPHRKKHTARKKGKERQGVMHTVVKVCFEDGISIKFCGLIG